ncbi:MAG: serine protease, partial [Myxococcales bacterium]|nr:serine protease [Myxococcales bacterium]
MTRLNPAVLALSFIACGAAPAPVPNPIATAAPTASAMSDAPLLGDANPLLGEANPLLGEANPLLGDAKKQGPKRVASTKLLDRRERTALAPDTLDTHADSAAVPKSSSQLYRAVAPATVIVRVAGGLGSGIVIDPSGWILTNHHVIDGGKRDDFVHKATVLLGTMSKEQGAMERAEKEYAATVYKSDKLRDIALLKLDEPPANLPSIKVAEKKPTPGDPVVALGHAGAGMLWALKSGEVSALGKLSQQLAMLAAFDETDDGKKARTEFQRQLDDANLGMVIQSTCNILPGDSGGPLVNDQGELIGLNVFTRRDFKTGGNLSFHVHLDELKSFLEKRPTAPIPIIPDPWHEGGADLAWEDADLDGRVDVLLMQGRKACAFCPAQSAAAFIDADQNSFAGQAALPDLADVFKKRNFDAEAVYLQVEGRLFVWYDSDDDGRFDKLLLDEGMSGRAKVGYDIDAEGHLTRKAEDAGEPDFRPALMANPAMHERFAKVARAAFPAHFTDGPEPGLAAIPDAIGRVGSAVAKDLNGDGRFDAADVSSPFSSRLLVDGDQRITSESGSVFFGLDKLKDGALDPEITIVTQGQHLWTFYDTDDDRRFDLALHAPGSRIYVALEAWKLDAAGARTAAPEHIGKKLIRPALVQSAAQRDTIRSMIPNGLLPIISATDEGQGAFPHPIDDHRGAGYHLLDTKGMPAKTVISVFGQGSDGYLVDLDANSGL